MAIVTVSKDNFDAVVENNDLVVADFWAPWCGPCQSFNTVVENLEKDFPDVTFAKINIDEQAELADEFDVKSVPAIMVIRSQVVVMAQSGTLSASALRDLIEQAKQLDSADLQKSK